MPPRVEESKEENYKKAENILIIKRNAQRTFHSVFISKKKPKEKSSETRNNSLWFLKPSCNSLAYCAVVAQEFYRLVIPGQTKTRLVKGTLEDTDSKTWRYHAISKQIPGYSHLSELFFLNTRLKTGMITGLGEIAAVSVVVNETDLNGFNLGLDNQNQIHKIDGDFCFARSTILECKRTPDYEYHISTATLEKLPNKPDDYNTYNWLVNLKKRKKDIPQSIVDNNLNKSSRIRHEVNHAILKMLLLPKGLIKTFVESYDPGEFKKDTDRMTEELTTRIHDQLFAAAIFSESFKKYLLGAQAEKEYRAYVAYLKNFKLFKKEYLLTRLSGVEQEIDQQFLRLRKAVLDPEDELDLPLKIWR